MLAAHAEWGGPDRLGPLLGLPRSTVHRRARAASGSAACATPIGRRRAGPLSRLPPGCAGPPGPQEARAHTRRRRPAGARGTRHPTPHRVAGIGYDHFEVVIDDRTRRAVVIPVARRVGRQRPAALGIAAGVLERLGIHIERVMTDNGMGLHGRGRMRESRARRPPQADTTLPAADQRQGGAVHPDPSPGVGIRPAISVEPGALDGSARLRRLLQSAPPTRRSEGAHPRRCQQRPWGPQLADLRAGPELGPGGLDERRVPGDRRPSRRRASPRGASPRRRGARRPLRGRRSSGPPWPSVGSRGRGGWSGTPAHVRPCPSSPSSRPAPRP